MEMMRVFSRRAGTGVVTAGHLLVGITPAVILVIVQDVGRQVLGEDLRSTPSHDRVL